MDFLKALEEAKKHGLTKEEFVRVWEAEMKLKQQVEETKTHGLRLSSGRHQTSSPQLETLLRDQLRGLHQAIKDMKNELLAQNERRFQEITSLLQNQTAMISSLNRGGFLDNVMERHGGFQSWRPDGSGPEANTSSQYYSQQQGLQTRKELTSSSWQLNFSSFPGFDPQIMFLPEGGVVFKLEDIESVVSSGSKHVSPYFYLSDCPCKVRLYVWFNQSDRINVQLTISGVSDQSLKACRIFTITGQVKNRNSGNYSPLFDGESVPLRKLRSHKEVQVKTNICLRTASGTYEDVTYQELVKRAFVIEDDLYIKWNVTSEEQLDSAD